MSAKSMPMPNFSQEETRLDGGEHDPGGGRGGGWNGDAGRLLEYARELAKRRDYTLDESFGQLFLQSIESRNPIQDNLHSDDEALMSTKKLVDQVMDIQDEETAGSRVLTAVMLRNVLSDFCPLWPFCR